MSRIQKCHWEFHLTKFVWRKHRKHLVANFEKSLEPAHPVDTATLVGKCFVISKPLKFFWKYWALQLTYQCHLLISEICIFGSKLQMKLNLVNFCDVNQ